MVSTEETGFIDQRWTERNGNKGQQKQKWTDHPSYSFHKTGLGEKAMGVVVEWASDDLWLSACARIKAGR